LTDATSVFFLGEAAPGLVVDYARLLTRTNRQAEALSVAQQAVEDNRGDETLMALRDRCEAAVRDAGGVS
jgi:hypothetical protein